MPIGRQITATRHTPRWMMPVRCGGTRLMSRCAYRYPARSAAWKKHTDTDHTDGGPPSAGSTILANIGCMANSSNAERNVVIVNTHIIAGAFRARSTKNCGTPPEEDGVAVGSF